MLMLMHALAVVLSLLTDNSGLVTIFALGDQRGE